MSLFTMQPGVTVTERQISGGCIRLIVNDEHVAAIMRERRMRMRLGLPLKMEAA